MHGDAQSLDIQALLTGYREERFNPEQIIELVLSRIKQQPDRRVWITRLSRQQLQVYLQALEEKSPDDLPLYGIPFAIKDNIDLAGVPTTAGCPDYAYMPQSHAFVVQCLIDAGALPIGKTNLDQFATGLVGTRSPYGACQNSFDADYISGGSSSGSAVAVATGQVSFSLGTDTAGSGRVPAAFNNLIGIKPSRGLLSTRGVVPACGSLDCVSIFALNSGDARRVLELCANFDARDPYARSTPVAIPGFNAKCFRFGVPQADQLEFFANREAAALFAQTVKRLEALGGTAVTIDFEPFLSAARLLYEGCWLTERYVAIERFIEEKPDALFPLTRQIIEAGKHGSAIDAFKSQYRLMEYHRHSEEAWAKVDLMLTPTAGTIYRIEEVERDAVKLNSNLGYYTNFMNLLDLCAVAVPAGFQSDGLPFGVTLIGRVFGDAALGVLADRLHRAAGLNMGATGLPVPVLTTQNDTPDGVVAVAVCGAHLSGLPLNAQLTDRGAWLMERTRTAPNYRLYALAGDPPFRPGLLRAQHGASIEVEVWALPREQVGSFLQLIPAPLGLGKLELLDGRWVSGFICEPYALEDARDVTRSGGWRHYIAESMD
ncbi:MAG: allophanate hydrolase [Thiogranum sp.]